MYCACKHFFNNKANCHRKMICNSYISATCNKLFNKINVFLTHPISSYTPRKKYLRLIIRRYILFAEIVMSLFSFIHLFVHSHTYAAHWNTAGKSDTLPSLVTTPQFFFNSVITFSINLYLGCDH